MDSDILRGTTQLLRWGGQRILHIGDAAPDPERIERYTQMLQDAYPGIIVAPEVLEEIQ